MANHITLARQDGMANTHPMASLSPPPYCREQPLRRLNEALLKSLLLPTFALVAILYASVGQAGGTGYIAVMGLIGFAPDVIKPTALALNILVAAIGCARFYRAGLLTWRSCYPFAVLGAPFSLLGGAVHLPASIYQPVAACCCCWRRSR